VSIQNPIRLQKRVFRNCCKLIVFVIYNPTKLIFTYFKPHSKGERGLAVRYSQLSVIGRREEAKKGTQSLKLSSMFLWLLTAAK